MHARFARWMMLLALLIAFGFPGTPTAAQTAPGQSDTPPDPLSTGRALFLGACANCHGADGTGSGAALVGLPVTPPDFTESGFASREPAADWAGVVTHGGPLRGFDRLMPAFGDALSRDEIDLILAYVQTLYEDKRWPRGEFNLPKALGTEKAYPEDEYYLRTVIATGEPGSVASRLVYEKRIGARGQIELVLPFHTRELVTPSGPAGSWRGGLGDAAIALKRVLFHDLGMGTITSFTLEVILPTGDESDGFGKGYTVLEPFLTWGQLLPLDAFLQVQAGGEFPVNTDLGEDEGLLRFALGRTFTAGGEWGRAISPMVEFLGSGDLEGGTWVWDVMPEIHFTLNQRQHIMANVGVRIPMTETDGRDPQIMCMLLWDWFDGGLFEGW
jgi:mono/diheme cytochrome c family protein